MFIFALLSGHGGGATVDSTAETRLAQALGVTAYEARLTLAGGFPAVILTTADEARARAVSSTLRGAGDDAVACDGAAVVPAEEMIALDRFTVGDDAITADGNSLPYADILCLLRAIHRSRAATETKTSERKFDVGKSILSGGLANSKVVTKTSKEAAETREPVLYVFRKSGEAPWILYETKTHYEGLGAARGLTTTANFATTVNLLRERAPHAPYDERLMHAHRTLERSSMQGTGARSTVTTSSASGVDVLAHLLALSFARAT